MHQNSAQQTSAKIGRVAPGPNVRVEAEPVSAPRCECRERHLFPVLFVSDFEGSPEYAYIVLHRYCDACAAAVNGEAFTTGSNNPLRGLKIRVEWRTFAAVTELLKRI